MRTKQRKTERPARQRDGEAHQAVALDQTETMIADAGVEVLERLRLTHAGGAASSSCSARAAPKARARGRESGLTLGQ